MKVVKVTATLRVIAAFLFIAGALSGCGKDDKKEEKKKEKVTIGFVNLTAAIEDLEEGYRVAMGELGYTEGENITYIYNGPVNDIDKLDAEVQKMVDAKVDLIVSLSTPAAVAAKRVTAGTGIPVLFFPSSDPVGAGVVDDIKNPGGNLTGIITGQSGSKQLEWLKTIVPDIERVYAPYNPNDPSPNNMMTIIREDAVNLGIDLVAVETPTSDDVLAAIETMPEDIDGILLIPDSLVGASFADFVAVSLERKIPLSASSKQFAEMGALMGFGADKLELCRQAARLGQKILNGTDPGSLPVETADFYLTINLVTASAIGITVPDTVLNSAKDVIRESEG